MFLAVYVYPHLSELFGLSLAQKSLFLHVGDVFSGSPTLALCIIFRLKVQSLPSKVLHNAKFALSLCELLKSMKLMLENFLGDAKYDPQGDHVAKPPHYYLLGFSKSKVVTLR